MMANQNPRNLTATAPLILDGITGPLEDQVLSEVDTGLFRGLVDE